MSDSRYTDLGLQPLAGEWRHGRAGRRLKVSNPFDGSLLLEIEQADRDDLGAAYAKAAEVQPAWAALGPRHARRCCTRRWRCSTAATRRSSTGSSASPAAPA